MHDAPPFSSITHLADDRRRTTSIPLVVTALLSGQYSGCDASS